MTATVFDERLARLEAGESLRPDEIRELGVSPDIVSLGMLADTMRRRLHGEQATYVRVAICPFDGRFADLVTPVAREIRLTGVPDSASTALTAVRSAKAIARDRVVSWLAWTDVERLAAGYDGGLPALLAGLRRAGLESLAELPLDTMSDAAAGIAQLQHAGFERLCLTIDAVPEKPRVDEWLRAATLQQRFGVIESLNPLPMTLRAFRPTTGYDDVRSVALARLAAPNIPRIQVDWTRYGPKLAQVALTFGADDVWGISASDEAPEGRRRAANEEIRRNIEAAGLRAAQRDGRYGVIE